MPLLDQIANRIKQTAQTEQDRLRRATGGYEPIGEPLETTEGESFDLGPTVDDANLETAGGYPPDPPAVIAELPEVLEPSTKKRTNPPRLISVRFLFAASDASPLTVTPSGIDADSIEQVTLVANKPDTVRVGYDGPNAMCGAFLPFLTPVTLTPGCVIFAWGSADPTATLDVFVVYRET